MPQPQPPPPPPLPFPKALRLILWTTTHQHPGRKTLPCSHLIAFKSPSPGATLKEKHLFAVPGQMDTTAANAGKGHRNKMKNLVEIKINPGKRRKKLLCTLSPGDLLQPGCCKALAGAVPVPGALPDELNLSSFRTWIDRASPFEMCSSLPSLNSRRARLCPSCTLLGTEWHHRPPLRPTAPCPSAR